MNKTLNIIIYAFLLVLISLAVSAQKCPFYGYEGDVIKASFNAYDADGDTLFWEYPLPFNQNGEWKTSIGDAGVHRKTFRVNDGAAYDSLTACIEVFPRTKTIPQEVFIKNNKPIINAPSTITAKAGEIVDPKISCYDLDGDRVSMRIEGMAFPYKVSAFDEGMNFVNIYCSDGKDVTQKVMAINFVKRNNPPIFLLSRVVVQEGDFIDLKNYIIDYDSEHLFYSSEEPLNNNLEWQTSSGDAGIYNVNVFVSDLENTVSQNFEIVVEKNPRFIDSALRFIIRYTYLVDPRTNKLIEENNNPLSFSI